MLAETSPTTADNLLTEVAADPWGKVAVSLYDTGRLVALAPWLTGHQARIEFLRKVQRPDGGWGGSDGYALVPTLSGAGALLAELARGGDDSLAPVAGRGLAVLHRWLDPAAGSPVPDTIGVELIVPALREELVRLAAALADRFPAIPEFRATAAGLPLPSGFDPELPAAARAGLAAGQLPAKSWACLEVTGEAAAGAPSIRPAGGSVGCSAAATAAWLGGPDGDPAGRRFLETLQARGGGPVPGVTPITYFEPAWVLNSLAIGGIRSVVPAEILDRLAEGLTDEGVPAAPGLPPDSDDTAAVLAALIRYGRPQPPDPLLTYLAGDYFHCFQGERNPSVSTNAHILETLALYLEHRPDEAPRFATPAATAARWLLAQQAPDGSWLDKWHASPYYATACCVIALWWYGGAPAAAAVTRARDWLLATQRPDGSWGRWQGTVEETAYAVQTLALTGAGGPAAEAIRRGRDRLAAWPVTADHPPLWHAKDLYTPALVIEAAQLAALQLAERVDRPVPAPRRGVG